MRAISLHIEPPRSYLLAIHNNANRNVTLGKTVLFTNGGWSFKY